MSKIEPENVTVYKSQKNFLRYQTFYNLINTEDTTVYIESTHLSIFLFMHYLLKTWVSYDCQQKFCGVNSI